MIPPRLREILFRLFLTDYVVDKGPKKGKRIVDMDRVGSSGVYTANYRATDLRTLERKGYITFTKEETMSSLWGIPWFSVKLAPEGLIEVEEEYAKRCAEADASNAKLENPDPFAETVEAGPESVRVRPRT